MQTVTENGLAVIVKESGLETATAENITKQFEPFYNQMVEWNGKAKTLVVTDATQLTEMQQARDARLALKKIRTGAEKVKDTLKADSLKYGRAVQAVYNFIEAGISPTEKYLQEQEDFAKIQEMNRKKEREAKRIEKLSPYVEQIEFYDLLNMEDNAFEELFRNSKAGYDARIAEAKRLEEEEKERQRVAEEKRQEMAAENERLRKQAEEKERLMREERLKHEQERREAEEKARKEREAAELEAKRLKDEQDAILEKERQERLKIEKELADKKAEEERLAKEAEERAEAELSKGDKEKWNDLVKDLESLQTKYVFRGKNNKAVHSEVNILLNKIINHITLKIK